MEVMLQTTNSFCGNVRKKKVLPLTQLVEETKRTTTVSRHLFETKSFAKVKSNHVIEAEPSELHFSGFEVGKSYKKTVKLVNISAEVVHVHIVPTQSKYFRTEYTQKSLVPGLAHSITVHFSPDEWRYFFDSIRIHCRGEENLMVNVHAYPVIDDLFIPSHINLFPVPLGHSSTCVIPLSCSCPVDFEFQVHCLKSHEAFNIHPFSGIIPAKGKTDLSVTFTPQQYGIADITIQLVIAQFNSKPFICTLTASCSPNLTLTQQRENEGISQTAQDLQTGAVVHLAAPKLKYKATPRLEKHAKRKIKSDPYTPSSDVNLSSHGRIAKMLIQQQDKMSYKDLREAMSRTKTAYQTRQMKEAAFERQVQVNAQKDQTNHPQWQVHLGEDLFSDEQKVKILKQQEVALSEYRMKKDMHGREMDITPILPKLTSHRVVRCSGQVPDCTPVFHVYGGSHLEVRLRVLRLFQQTVRKVILQVRMNKRLLLLRELVSSTKRQERSKGTHEKKQLLNVSSEKLLPFTLPSCPSPNHNNKLGIAKIGHVDVGQIEEELTITIPFFKPKVPQHYKLMGYQEVPVYGSKSPFVLNKQCRLLLRETQSKLLPTVMSPDLNSYNEKELKGEDRPEPSLNPGLVFRAPPNVLNAQYAHPLRIFNPAPHVYAFKPTPLYLESDPEFHLCPLTRHSVCQDHIVGVHSKSTHKKFLDKEALNTVSSVPAQTSSRNPHIHGSFSSILLPLEAPPSLKDLPDNIREEISFVEASETGVNLNPDMVQAEFLAFENSTPKIMKEDCIKNDRETHDKPLESSLTSTNNFLGSKVLARMQHMKSMSRNHFASHDQ